MVHGAGPVRGTDRGSGPCLVGGAGVNLVAPGFS